MPTQCPLPLPGVAGGTQSANRSAEKLRLERLAIPSKCHSLGHAYLVRAYRDSQAQKYAGGLARRLKLLARCIDQVFKLVPPDQTSLPERDDLCDATIFLHAFVFNVFASVDNLAWIWALERGLRKNDGQQLPVSSIGLREKNKDIRRTFSPRLQEYLGELDAWFDYLENLRHALAHREPFYILPHMVPKDNVAAYQELDERRMQALERRDLAEHARLLSEQKALAVFIPYVVHSFAGEPELVIFHAQILVDLITIVDLGREVLGELNRYPVQRS